MEGQHAGLAGGERRGREAWGVVAVMVLIGVGRKSLERKGQSRSPHRRRLALGQRGQGKAIVTAPLAIPSLRHQIVIEHVLMSQVLGTHN